jgi:hypothetical protein
MHGRSNWPRDSAASFSAEGISAHVTASSPCQKEIESRHDARSIKGERHDARSTKGYTIIDMEGTERINRYSEREYVPYRSVYKAATGLGIENRRERTREPRNTNSFYSEHVNSPISLLFPSIISSSSVRILRSSLRTSKGHLGLVP